MAHFTEAAVTDAGNELLNEMMAGRYVKVTRAAGGQGTVEEAQLHEQTELKEEKQALSIIDDTVDKQGRTISVQIGNASETYKLEQIGVFGKLTATPGTEGEDGEETLLFILQDRQPIDVPDTSAPTFMLNIYTHLNINNVGRFTVTIDKTGIVNIEFLEKKLAEHNADSGAHKDIAARVKAMETAMNGSETIVQDGDPTEETVGEKGQHYINPETGKEYVCTEAAEGRYTWEQVESEPTVYEQFREDIAAHDKDPNAHLMPDDHAPENLFRLGVEDGKLYIQTVEEE